MMRGYIHQRGTQIYDGDGKPILLKGVGFGNWLLPEGYMWKFYEQCDRPRRIERLITELLGADEAETFWHTYYDTYISRDDIQYIHDCELNSVRLPINARLLMKRSGNERTILEGSLIYIDRLLEWCEDLGLYVILDMHAAPGGQTGTNIDDSVDDRPLLFEDECYREDLIWLWQEIAMRYRDNPYVAGYDLLNEPLPEWFGVHNDKVMPLYYELVNAIREVDQNHLVLLEGVHWATDWSIFEVLADRPIDNCMLEFHKYWDNPDTESIQKYLDVRDKLGYPVFMGEGGENNLGLYAGVFHLLEQHDIGWNFWTYKKLDTHNSPISINKPVGWDEVIDYIDGGDKPVHVKTILKTFLSNIKFDNCFINHDVMNHVMRRVPVKLSAVFYNRLNKTFGHQSNVAFRENDGVDIRFVVESGGELSFKHGGGEEPRENQRLCLAIAEGEVFSYSFVANKEKIYIRCRSKNGGCILTYINGRELQSVVPSHTMETYYIGNSDRRENILQLKSDKSEVEVECIIIK